MCHCPNCDCFPTKEKAMEECFEFFFHLPQNIIRMIVGTGRKFKS